MFVKCHLSKILLVIGLVSGIVAAKPEIVGPKVLGVYPNHYVQDANKFAEWGIDYVKVDNFGGSGSSQSVVKGMYKVVGLLNRSSSTTSMSISWTLLEVTGKQTVRDLWQRTDLGIFEDAFSCDVASRECVMLKIKPEPQTPIKKGTIPPLSVLQLKQLIVSGSSVKLLFSVPMEITDKNFLIKLQIYSGRETNIFAS